MEPIHITVSSGSGSYVVSVGDGLTARLDALLDALDERVDVAHFDLDDESDALVLAHDLLSSRVDTAGLADP